MQSNEQNTNKRRTRSQVQQLNPKQKQINLIKNQSQNALQMDVNNQGLKINQIAQNNLTKNQKIFPKKSNWSKKQKIRYMVFINYYSQLPDWRQDSKSLLKYKILSLFIKSRSPQQCKSFHLAIKKTVKTIQQAFQILYEQLQNEQNFHKLIDRYEMEIITFEQRHKLLQNNQLTAKNYIKNKYLNNRKQRSSNDYLINSDLNYKNQYLVNQYVNYKESASNNSIQPISESYQPSQQIYKYHKLNEKFIRNYSSASQNIHEIKNINKQKQSNNEEGIETDNLKNLSMNQILYGPNRLPYQQQFSKINLSLLPGQIPFNIPPPYGGFPYIMQQYQNQTKQHHFPYQLKPNQSIYNLKNNPKTSQYQINQKKLHNFENNKNEQNQQQEKMYEKSSQLQQKHKQLILKCHIHWINWMAAVIELKKRKQSISQNN